ncbi:uncharacterized protein LOC131601484 [Vicia villosa]|uniref:uncharacterized protein LOC131601484 n=1 Tax=Vicia villosa TaxID=3911 RepID=UPI00273B6A1F|nr:uncharacterized protein LOC131601484 [Vicia villosa]
MDKNRDASVFVLVLLVLGFFTFSIANANTNRVSYDEEDESKKSSFWVWEKFRRAYSMYSSIFPTSVGQYWHMVKAIFNHTYAYFFPPNIDFRKGGEVQVVKDENGVKEAFSKSIGTSKATLEDVAKSAAEKVKRSLSHDRKEKKEL